MKRFLVLVVGLLVVLTGCTSGSDGSDKFIVGMECGYAPYNWTQANSTDTSVPIEGGQHCDGYDVQIAKLIADELGLELEIRRIAWDGLILSLETNQIDAIIAGMSETPDRAETIDFSSPYYTEEVEFGVVVKKGGKYETATGISDFSDARISAQIGTFHPVLRDQLLGISKADLMKDFPTMTISVQAGELDGFIADTGTGRSINESAGDLLYIQLDGSNGFKVEDYMKGVSVGINKNNNELLQKVNDAISKISVETQSKLMDAAISGSPNE